MQGSSELRVKPIWLLVALGVWCLLTFGHGEGLKIAGRLFAWAKEPGVFTEEGGVEGLARLERIMGLVFASIGVSVFGLVAYRLRKVEGRRLVEELVPWALWAVLLYLIWTCFIVYATELVHFAQYALVGFLVAWALDRGKHPQLAFLITISSGFVDEIYQHYWLHMGEMVHWMDWSDPVLDALGAAGGILPFVTLARIRGEQLQDSFHLVKRALVVASLLFLPLLLLDPVDVSKYLGHYRYYPFWGEYENHKPTHWPHPREGVPLCLGMLLLLGILMEPKRRHLSQAGLLVVAACLALAIKPSSRREGMPVHEVVPEAKVPWTAQPIVADGVLDEPAWATAVRVGPFVHSQTGANEQVFADDSRVALHETYARLLWSDQALYVAFEVTDPDVWARETTRDDPFLPGDEVVEIFLDAGGDEVTYYEIEVSPANVVYDLFVHVPSAPQDYDPFSPFLGLANWDARGLLTGVTVDGTLETADWGPPVKSEADRGYVIEIAFPWENLRTTSTPSSRTKRNTVYPHPGDRWRLNMFRLERPRVSAEAPGEQERLLSREEAQARIRCTDEEFELAIERTYLTPEQEEGADTAEARFREPEVVKQVARHAAQLQAWSPTYVPSFHQPRFFGVIEFVKE